MEVETEYNFFFLNILFDKLNDGTIEINVYKRYTQKKLTF